MKIIKTNLAALLLTAILVLGSQTVYAAEKTTEDVTCEVKTDADTKADSSESTAESEAVENEDIKTDDTSQNRTEMTDDTGSKADGTSVEDTGNTGADGQMTETDNESDGTEEKTTQADTENTDVSGQAAMTGSDNGLNAMVDAENGADETKEKKVDIYSSKDDKINYIISLSFSQCAVCKSEDEHKTHMVSDEILRQYLFYPDKYFEANQKGVIVKGIDVPLEAASDNSSFAVSQTSSEMMLKASSNDSDAVDSAAEETDTDITASDDNETDSKYDKTADLDTDAAGDDDDEKDIDDAADGAEDGPADDVDDAIEDDTEDETETDAVKTDNLKQAENTKTETEETEEITGEKAELTELYRLVESEAGIESIRCKEAVAQVVLNRVRSDKFPDSIHSVIHESGAFAVIGNRSINNVSVTQETVDAVNSVYEGDVLIDSNIYFFRNKHYFKWCKPVMSIDHTYFSTFYHES